jgi:long-chain acyl-CoA synthetase
LKRKLAHKDLTLDSEEGRKYALKKLEKELNKYKKGGDFEGMFPERWLPSTFAVLPEPFTEQNQMINSTMKMVRGKIEKAYAQRINFLYTPEGKQIFNQENLDCIK